MPGTIESSVMIVPQNTAPWIPTTANEIPASVPWTTPIRRVPLIVARVTETNFPTMRASSSSGSGR